MRKILEKLWCIGAYLVADDDVSVVNGEHFVGVDCNAEKTGVGVNHETLVPVA